MMGHMRRGRMYIRCTRCGEEWNVSLREEIPEGGYLCPACEEYLNWAAVYRDKLRRMGGRRT